MSKGNILILVEGAKTDVRLMTHLLRIYGISENHKIVSYNTNIYTLYNQMFKDNDPYSIDLLQLLKEYESDPQTKLLFDERYSDILLIFDLEPQDPQFSKSKIECNIVINQNIDKAWKLTGEKIEIVNVPPEQTDILAKQLKKLNHNNEVSILCTCGFYIADYNPNLIS